MLGNHPNLGRGDQVIGNHVQKFQIEAIQANFPLRISKLGAFRGNSGEIVFNQRAKVRIGPKLHENSKSRIRL